MNERPFPIRFDEAGYPADEMLAAIAAYEPAGEWTREEFIKFMQALQSAWWHGARLVTSEFDGAVWHLSTGGWSGNEDLIEALKKNWRFYPVFFEGYIAGGHYVFIYDRLLYNVEIRIIPIEC